MRIGLVCPYSFDAPGGVQNHVGDLAQALLARGHAVGVLAPGERSRWLGDHVTTTGRAVAVPYNGSVARLAFGPRVALRTRRWLQQGEYDVLHVHEPATPSVSLLALWAAQVPVVATFHTATGRSRAMSAVSAMMRPTLEKVTAQIAVSEAARETLVHHLGGEPVVIPNGIFTQAFELSEADLRWSGPGSTLVFLGRVDEPRKGLTVLLDAMPDVLASYPDARLVVAGRGDVESLGLAAGVRDRVEFVGEVSDGERTRLLASADVFIAPHTRGESFGIVLVEAMAAGAAVVASDLPAFRALAGDGRFARLCSVGQPDSLAAAVRGLLADPEERRALAARGQVRARRYDWSSLVTQIEAVYEMVLVAASGRP